MVKSILKYVIMIVAVTAGVVGADFLKSQKSAASSAVGAHSEDGDDTKAGHDAKDGSKEKSESDDKSGSTGGETYLKFKRQFVVPVTHNGKIDSLVIMNFNLLLNEDAPENSFNLEPKLRDAFTRELLDLSNSGYFGDNITSPESYERVRSTLLFAARRIIQEGIDDILILDIAKQDQ